MDHAPVPDEFDVVVPSAARIYDYMLGGGHNFEADRQAAQRLLAAVPARDMARLNRSFLRRAVLFLIDTGIRQFLDLGSGIPTVGNVHEVAQKALRSRGPKAVGQRSGRARNSPRIPAIGARRWRGGGVVVVDPSASATVQPTDGSPRSPSDSSPTRNVSVSPAGHPPLRRRQFLARECRNLAAARHSLMLGFPGLNDVEWQPATVTDIVAILLGPLPDGLERVAVVTASRDAPVAGLTADRTVCATRARAPPTGLTGSRDVTSQVITKLGGVVVRQVDLVRDAFERELDCRNVLSFLASEVIDEGDDGLLSHGYGFSLQEERGLPKLPRRER